jgi:hypothetical protein
MQSVCNDLASAIWPGLSHCRSEAGCRLSRSPIPKPCVVGSIPTGGTQATALIHNLRPLAWCDLWHERASVVPCWPGPEPRGGNVAASRRCPAGSLRMKVYAGTDPVSGRRHDLTETIPPGPTTKRDAQKALTRLLNQLDEQRSPGPEPRSTS